MSCELIDESTSLSQQLVRIIGLASATDVYDDARAPAYGLLPATDIRRTLKRYAVDAVAAAIEDGPKCFGESASWNKINGQKYDMWWSSDSRPTNAVSRFSRQLRTQMNKPENEGIYVGEGRVVLAVGVVFEYLRGYGHNGRKQYNLCMMGGSIAGENATDSFGDLPSGSSNDHELLPPGDWSEVYNEAFLIMLLGLAVVMFPHFPRHIWTLKSFANQKRGLSFWFGLFVVVVSVQIIWATSSTANLIIGPSFK